MKRKNNPCSLFLIILLWLSTTLWADNYWQLPIPPQGNAPQTHHPLTHNLNPKSCGLCHKKQYEEWQNSWHAKAASAGLLGQLYYFDQDNSESCLSCHTPRSEQIEQWQTEQLNYQGTGIDCASCHLRQHQRHGANEKTTTPHGKVQKKALFKQTEFCSPCHQFSAGKGLTLAGTFLENTHQEWQQSSWGKQNTTCQDCHMPNGSHQFKGIHDADMTRLAFKIRAIREATGLRLLLTNHAAGHALPTYATPRIVVTLTSDNNEQKQHIIQRQLYLDAEQHLQQKADSRLHPNQTLELFLTLTPQQQASATVRVEPDHFYQHVIYPYFLDDNNASNTKISKEEQKARQLLQQAQQEKRDYTLYDIQCPRWQQKKHECTLFPTPATGDPMIRKKEHHTL